MDQSKKYGREGGGHPTRDDQAQQSTKQTQNSMKWVPKGQKSEEEPHTSSQQQSSNNDQSQQQQQQRPHTGRGRGNGRGNYRGGARQQQSDQSYHHNNKQQQHHQDGDYSQKEQQQQNQNSTGGGDGDNQNESNIRGRGQRGGYRGGRGGHRGGYQQKDTYSQHHIKETSDQTDKPQQEYQQNDSDQSQVQRGRGGQSNYRGSRGGRGQSSHRGGRGRGGTQQYHNYDRDDNTQQDIDSVSQSQDDSQSVQSQQPNRGRGNNRGGTRGGRGTGRGQQRVRDSDYFEQRKYEREQFEGGLSSDVNRYMQQYSGDAQDKNWSRKMDTGNIQGGAHRTRTTKAKNLGSASQYLAGAGGGGDDRNQYLPTKDEKIGYINDEDEKRELEAKEKAQIKYNYQDFLNQFQNLSEQCCYFVENLAKGTQECIICHNPIFQRSALWNCNQCHQPLHLGCIKRWIKKLNNVDDLEEVKVAPGQQNRRGQLSSGSEEYSDEEEKQYETEARKAAKKLVAFFTWTCPNCNFAYAENSLPRYLCYCGRYDEPEFSPLILPHSCGEYCDKKRNDICTHSRCDVLCHPGSCPPCGIQVPVKCFCGKDTKRVPCQLSQRSQYSCQQTCSKLLNCLHHECQELCHQGQCKKCDIDIEQKCFCGKEQRIVKCGSKRFLCQKICGKALDCGNHSCQKVCHEGPCQPCQKVPSRVKFCPCGRKDINTLMKAGEKRTSCLDPIPTCQSKCDKFLPCGKHQCSLKCHNDDCMLCEEPVDQDCVCGKEKRKLKCYQMNYPDHLKLQLMSTEELEEIEIFKCKRICNQHQSCKKHKCKELCCPVRKGYDPFGKHLCLKTCNKTLSCGKHQCNTFCHLGLCKPCNYVSNQPLPCPCGQTKIDPPIKCGTQQPTCNNTCGKQLACGHKCNVKCHLGNCPPCLEIVTKVCNCGSEIMPNVYCNQQKHSCGQTCKRDMPCGHKCQQVCHAPGKCFTSLDDMMLNGCGEPCGKQRTLCKHRCLENCHPQNECPENPCDAEIRVYCKCGHRFVNTLCKSIPERDPIECNSECWKHQREKKLAVAFGSGGQVDKNNINLEYYPEEVLEFAGQFPKFVKKCENALTDIVLEKAVRSFSGLGSHKKAFLTTLVFEHFKLDMCTYGGRNQKTVTDVFWKEGCKVPELMVSEVIQLIEKGIMSANNDDNRNQIFEATLFITNVPKSSTIDDLKKFMFNFKNEMYTQKGKQQGAFYIHFYKKMRAKDAYTYIKNTPNQFTNVELIMHKKEIGVNSDSTPLQSEMQQEKKKVQKKAVVDDDGFMTVVKKK